MERHYRVFRLGTSLQQFAMKAKSSTSTQRSTLTIVSRRTGQSLRAIFNESLRYKGISSNCNVSIWGDQFDREVIYGAALNLQERNALKLSTKKKCTPLHFDSLFDSRFEKINSIVVGEMSHT
eukprot:1185683-Prorocentrum_minimum.AAC.6